jgi:hypothetical protein
MNNCINDETKNWFVSTLIINAGIANMLIMHLFMKTINTGGHRLNLKE